MAEKRGVRIEDNTGLKPEKAENPADFLARVGVTRQMQEVLSIILENRPDDPIAYIAEYFSNAAEEISSVTQAYQFLNLSHHSQTSYKNNVLKAFQVLNKQKWGHGLTGLIGKSYNELLHLLCRDITSHQKDSCLLQLLQRREQDVIGFNAFNAGVTCCFLYHDYILEAKSLYEELDVTEKGHADYTLCTTMLAQLKTSVSTTKENSSLSILEAGLSLSTQNIDMVIKKMLCPSANTGKIMSLDEFIQEASEIFFMKIMKEK